VGGSTGSGGLASAEVYTPATEAIAASWTATPALNEGRLEHTATLLPDGRVLVAGGSKITLDSNATNTAETYSPSSNSWALAGSLATARHSHIAVLLTSGQVLVAGGIDTTSLASAELYDQGSDAWTSTGEMTVGRQHATVSLIRRGEVLVAGGLSFGEHLRSAEIYSPSRGRSSHRLRSSNSP
jgi:Kelch motif protein